MKKRLLYFTLLLGGICELVSCFDDKSVEPYKFIPDILIDTTGIPYQHAVTQYERLKISPVVSLENGEQGDLSFKWMLNTIPTITQATSSYYANYYCIGEKMALDTIIELRANQTTYYLWYQVTDNNTGIRKDILWTVFVQTAYNEGLVIADSRDNSTTDLSVIEGNLFTIGWNKEDRISRNLYSAANGAPYVGIAKHIVFAMNTHSSVNAKQLYVVGDDCFELLDGIEYKRVGRNHEVMYDDKLTLNTTQIFISGGSYMCWVNAGKIYTWYMSSLRPYPHIEIPEQYSLQVGDNMVQKTGRVDRYMAYTHKYSSSSYPWGIWYDDVNGVFLSQRSAPSVQLSITPFNSGGVFDPNNATGLRTLYAATGMNDDFYFIMRNTNTSSNQVYVFDRTQTLGPKALYTIPGNEMDQAIAYVVAENANTFYFATQTQIYAVTLSGGSPQVHLRYTVPSGGTISCFTMFRHAWYLRNLTKTPLDTHEQTLLVGVVESGNNGKLLAIPILNPASADIDAVNIKTYTGFGKITAIAAQE
jgi:hypothetical protein